MNPNRGAHSTRGYSFLLQLLEACAGQCPRGSQGSGLEGQARPSRWLAVRLRVVPGCHRLGLLTRGTGTEVLCRRPRGGAAGLVPVAVEASAGNRRPHGRRNSDRNERSGHFIVGNCAPRAASCLAKPTPFARLLTDPRVQGSAMGLHPGVPTPASHRWNDRFGGRVCAVAQWPPLLGARVPAESSSPGPADGDLSPAAGAAGCGRRSQRLAAESKPAEVE